MTKELAKEKESNKGKKKVYYISAEFLIGKLLSNNLINLGILIQLRKNLKLMARASMKLKKLNRNHHLVTADLEDLQPASLIQWLHWDLTVTVSALTTIWVFSNRYLRIISRKKLLTHGLKKRAGLQNRCYL